MSPRPADMSGWTDSPHYLAVDAKGYVWRAYIGESRWSMAPVNPDNGPIPEPITYYAALPSTPGALDPLASLKRMTKIADMHRKSVDEHGGTTGECTECGRQWPCPTYDWARETSDRDPVLSCWDRSDDDD